MPAHYDLICLSHLQWDFVYQRPHHLMTRFARDRRVFFVEEPRFDSDIAELEMVSRQNGVVVVIPHLPADVQADPDPGLAALMSDLLEKKEIRQYLLWYYTPMALNFSRHLRPLITVYDCMDELSAFAKAPPALRALEMELFDRADLVFTGGESLYESKKTQHPLVHLFPSSVDVPHFHKARRAQAEPADQLDIPRPRIGFFGVIDERMDFELVREIAQLRPEWQIVLVGPVADAKIDVADVPNGDNVHHLGSKSYDDLPAYIAGWDVAILPFAKNEATRYISPTKTPEYLAAGLPVVATSIRDVVRPYGQAGLVHVADGPEEFVAAIEAAMNEDAGRRLQHVDDFLQQLSWDRTWSRMSESIESVAVEEEIEEAVRV